MLKSLASATSVINVRLSHHHLHYPIITANENKGEGRKARREEKNEK